MKNYLRKLRKSYLLLRTQAYVFILRAMGRKIKIGKNTIFMPGSKVNPGNGIITMGKNCFIGNGTIIKAYDGKICFEDNVSIGEYCILNGRGKIYFGKNCLLATHISIIPASHNFAKRDIPIKKQGINSSYIFAGQDVWIGSGSRILQQVRIGKGAIIGAGSIVTSDISSYGIFAGNPARKIKDRPEL